MKKYIILAVVLALASTTYAQLPSVKLKSLDGKEVNTATLSNDGKPMILTFWATYCKPCIKELKAFHDLYPDWLDETGVRIIAVSIDDARTNAQVRGLANSNGWEFDILLDVNGDFKRAMNVVNAPHLFVIDGQGKIVYQHTGYSEGSENALYDKIRKLHNGETL